MIGIYKITNQVNQKSYIGQSLNIKRRWRHHKTSYQTIDTYLYRAMRKYGIENFSFEVLKECQQEELNQFEQYYIQYYDTFYNGYNLTLGGDSSKNSSCPDQIQGIIADLKNTSLTQQEIADKWGLGVSMVQGINTGVHWRQNIPYPIREKAKAQIFTCKNCGEEISYGSILCINCYKLSQREGRPNRNFLKQLIREKTFVEIGSQFGVTDNTIRKWCKAENLPYRKKDIKTFSDKEWESI